MLKWLRLAAVCGVVLAWSNEAFAVVQSTDVVATKPAAETGSATLTLTQKDSSNRPVKTDTIRIARNQPRARQVVRIDPDKAKTVEVTIQTDKGRGTVSVDVARLLAGGPIDLGNGFTIQGTPAAATRQAPAPRTAGPARRAPAPDPTFINYAGFTFGQPGGFAVDVGLTGGGTFRSTGGSDITGVDNFLGTHLTDRRSVGIGGDSGFVGGMVNVWQVSPGPRWFFQTGVNVPVSGSSSVSQTGLNTGALGGANSDATFTYKVDWMIPLMAGISGPIGNPYARYFPWWQDPRWRIGGGGIITHSKLTVSGVDGGARQPYSASKSSTTFDPGFLVGLRGGIGGGWILGADLMFTWRGDKDITAPSTSFPGTQAVTGHLDGGVDTTLQFSLSRTLGAPAPPP